MRGMKWEEFDAGRCARVRITESSCCGAFEWVAQGGQFLVLRHSERGFEEIGRGRYAQARQVWNALIAAHQRRHEKRLSPGRARRRQRHPPGVSERQRVAGGG
jgi:hypothetical protein